MPGSCNTSPAPDSARSEFAAPERTRGAGGDQSNPILRHIPVVILTTSHSEKDVLQAYYEHANCYIVKPVGFINFVEAVKAIRQFWFGVVTLPLEAPYG